MQSESDLLDINWCGLKYCIAQAYSSNQTPIQAQAHHLQIRPHRILYTIPNIEKPLYFILFNTFLVITKEGQRQEQVLHQPRNSQREAIYFIKTNLVAEALRPILVEIEQEALCPRVPHPNS